MKSTRTILSLGALATAGIIAAAIGTYRHASPETIDVSAIKARQAAEITHTTPTRKVKAATPSYAASQDNPTLRGLVINSSTPYICEFSADNPANIENLYDDEDLEATAGAFFAEGLFYVGSVYSPSVGVTRVAWTSYDTEEWEIQDEKDNLPSTTAAVTITYDATAGVEYGYFIDEDAQGARVFGRMNPTTATMTPISSISEEEEMLAIASAPGEYIYGVNINGMYCRIAKANGAITKLGHTDIKPANMQSAVIDPKDGTFYWAAYTDDHKSGLYKIDPTTFVATLVGSFPLNQEIVGLYIETGADYEDIPEAIDDIKADFKGAELTGTVSFDAPSFTNGGDELSDELIAHVAVDGNHFTAPTSPGESCTLNINVNQSGMHVISAWVSDGDLQGEKAFLQKWIGPDNPRAVTNLKLERDGNTVHLSWNAPSDKGQHNGYVNPQDIDYWVGAEDLPMKMVSDWRQTEFTYEIPEGISAEAKFYVRPFYKELPGPYAYTKVITVGDRTFTPPVDFNPSEIGKFIVIDANNDNNTWEQSFGYALFDSGSGQGDDWLLTPAMRLEEGQLYELTYDVSAKMGIMSPETIEVMLGQGDTPAAMTLQVDSKTISTMMLTSFTTHKVTFTAPATGVWRLGFHATSVRGAGLGLSEMSIKPLASTTSPVAATDLSVTAAPLGELKASLTFTTPVLDISGNPISKLSKAVVYCGDEPAGSVENPEPGKQYTVDNLPAVQGMNTYSVVCIDSESGRGLKAETQGWVGLDIPSTPQNPVMVENAESVTLTWTLPEKGIHGGYVNPDNVVYSLVDPDYMIEFFSFKGGSSAEIPLGDIEEQASLAFAIVVSNEAGTNLKASVTPLIMVGPPYQLPVIEHFGIYTDLGWTLLGTPEYEQGGWSPADEDKGPDGSYGYTTYAGLTPADAEMLASGKIDLRGASDPRLRLKLTGYTNTAGNGGRFEAMISETFGKDYTPVYTRTFTSEDSKVWSNVEVSLKDYAGKIIYLAFRGVPAECPTYEGYLVMGMDDVNVLDVKKHDLTALSMEADGDEAEVGIKPVSVSAIVANNGSEEVAEGAYTVEFLAGDRIFASAPGKRLEAAFGRMKYSAVYEASVEDNDPVELHVRVVYDNEENPVDNDSAPVYVYVIKPERPVATGLEATVINEGVRLNWIAPDLSGTPVRTVTDDFESYRPFDVNRAGKWNIVDEDKSYGTQVSYSFPGSSGAIGWIVMKPVEIPRAAGGTYADILPPYSGEHYMAAFAPSSGDNKDWLITPRLSGNAQTISFMARAESAEMGREMFEVYVSSTGNSINDMQRLDDTVYRTETEGWSEFTFEIPAGSLYFAVRCVSHNRRAMHIDDFKYESAAIPLEVKFLGYNVYRNGECLNEEPVQSTEFTDLNAGSDRDCTYTVKVAYDRGESDACDPATVHTSGVELVLSDIDPSVETVYNLQGIRVNVLTKGEIYITRGQRFLYLPK